MGGKYLLLKNEFGKEAVGVQNVPPLHVLKKGICF